MRIPIGIDDFKRLVTDVNSEGEHYFYCDKSMIIKDIIDDGALVSLFTRPRRFGKTLNMSMLYYFFDRCHSLPPVCHPRENGDPGECPQNMDSRFRGNDKEACMTKM